MKYKSLKSLNYLLFVLLCLLVLFVGLLCCVPPIGRDALTHHLAIPARYLSHGEIYEIPSLDFSYYPMTLDLLYIIPLYFGNDIIPKFIHFSFALLTGFLIFRHLDKRLNRFYALLCVILFLTTPIILKLSTTAYVDLALIFFTTASVLYLLKWINHGFTAKHLILSAVFCGLCLGIKYNGLLTFLLLTLFVPFLYSRYSSSANKNRALVYSGIFFIIASVIFSPWAIRNFLWTGNPIYPLFNSVFTPHPQVAGIEPSDSDEEKTARSHFVIRHFNYEESFFDILLVPIRIFFQGQDGNPKYFDGRLNPLLLILPVFAFIRLKDGEDDKIKTERYVLLSFSVLFVLIAFFSRDMRIRYISPVVPLLSILSMYGLNSLSCMFRKIPRAYLRKALSVTSVGIILTLFYMNISYAKHLYSYVKPMRYLTGEVNRAQYIENYVHEYPVLRFANQNLPERSTILGLFLGYRSYYSDRDMLFSKNIFLNVLKEANHPSQLVKAISENGFSHLLIRYDLFLKWVHDNIDEGQRSIFNDFIKNHMELLYMKNGYALFAVKPNNDPHEG